MRQKPKPSEKSPMVYDPRPTLSGSRPLKQMCTHFKNVYAFQNPFRVHTITNDFKHLTHCVQCVRCVRAFLGWFRRFSKTRFYFINRTSTWKHPVHTVHSLQPPCFLTFTLLKCVHMCVHSAYTRGSNAYTFVKAVCKPSTLTVNHGPCLSILATRSSVGFFGVLVNKDWFL